MPDPRYVRCRICNRSASEVGELSWQRLCVECGDARRYSNIVDLRSHSGPWFDNWRRAMAASVGGVLIDDVNARP